MCLSLLVLRAHWGTFCLLTGERILVSVAPSQKKPWWSCSPPTLQNFLSSLFLPSPHFSWVIMSHSDLPHITDIPLLVFAVTFITLTTFWTKTLLFWYSNLFTQAHYINVLKKTVSGKNTNSQLESNFRSEDVENRFELCTYLGELGMFPLLHLLPARAVTKWHLPRLKSWMCVRFLGFKTLSGLAFLLPWSCFNVSIFNCSLNARYPCAPRVLKSWWRKLYKQEEVQ